jgi:hypothetical protein
VTTHPPAAWTCVALCRLHLTKNPALPTYRANARYGHLHGPQLTG